MKPQMVYVLILRDLLRLCVKADALADVFTSIGAKYNGAVRPIQGSVEGVGWLLGQEGGEFGEVVVQRDAAAFHVQPDDGFGV